MSPSTCRTVSRRTRRPFASSSKANKAHARRKLEEKKEQWPAAWKYVKSVYKAVYANEAKAKVEGMSPEERLALHREKSLPLMREMFRWMDGCFKNKTVEPNSSLGKIFEYFLTREYGLTMFCRHAGFPYPIYCVSSTAD